MVPELTQIMSFLDRNSENFKEGEYLEMCNLLMSLHKKMETISVSPEFASTQPLPNVNIPFTPEIASTQPLPSVNVPFTPEFASTRPLPSVVNSSHRVFRFGLLEGLIMFWVRMTDGRKKEFI